MNELFNKLMNLVVEMPAENAADTSQKTVAELVAEAHGPDLHEVRVEVPHAPHPASYPVSSATPGETAGHPAAAASAAASSSAAPARATPPSGGEVAPPSEAKPASASAGAALPMPQVGADGKADFSAIYTAAGLASPAFSAEQAIAMIDELPKELPEEVRRLTVRTTMTAMGKSLGVSPDTVVTDAARKVAALTSFTDNLKQRVSDYEAGMEQEITNLKTKIAELEGKIVEYQSSIEGVKQKQREVHVLCEEEAHRFHELADFFRSDVSPPSA
jgi:hypothetical protein